MSTMVGKNSADGKPAVPNITQDATHVIDVGINEITPAFLPTYLRGANITLSTADQDTGAIDAGDETEVLIWSSVDCFYRARTPAGTAVTILNGYPLMAGNVISIKVPATYEIAVVAAVAGGTFSHVRIR